MHRIKYEDRKLLPNLTAVYVVRSATEVLYVGSTWTLRERMLKHNKKKDFVALGACLVEWLEVSDEVLGDEERRLVRSLMPTLNSNASRPKKRKPVQAVCKVPQITSLRDETRTLLASYMAGKAVDKTLTVLAEEMQVSVNWIKLFVGGKIANPGVNTIETLNVYLKKAR